MALVLLCLVILVGLLLIGAGLAYRTAFYSPNKKQNDFHNLPKGPQYEALREPMKGLIRSFEALPFEKVAIRSKDGLILSARYYESRPGGPVALCFHGYRGTGVRDFSGGAQLCLKLGQNVLLVDQRAHGESGGHTITFGIREKEDCLCWIGYANARFGADRPLYLYGVSMGASTVLLAAGEALPPNVAAIVADSPYDSVPGILKKVCRDKKLPLYPLLALGARLFGDFSPARGDIGKAVARSKTPILILHGEDDRFVPVTMSQGLKASYPQKLTLCTFPGAGHGISCLVSPAAYQRSLRSFLASLPVAPSGVS